MAEIFLYNPIEYLSEVSKDEMRWNAEKMARINRAVLLEGYHATPEDIGPGLIVDFFDRKVSERGESRLYPKEGVSMNLPPIIADNDEFAEYEMLDKAMEKIVSPLAKETRKELGLEGTEEERTRITEEVMNNGLSNGEIWWAGAATEELGLEEYMKSRQGAKLDTEYEELGRMVAEIAAWGSDSYPVDTADRLRYRMECCERIDNHGDNAAFKIIFGRTLFWHSSQIIYFPAPN